MVGRVGLVLAAVLLGVSLWWTVPLAVLAVAFGPAAFAQGVFLLYVLAGAQLWYAAKRAEGSIFVIRLCLLLMLPALLFAALDLELVPPVLPYTPLRGLSIWGAFLLPFCLPPAVLLAATKIGRRPVLLLVATGLSLAAVLLGPGTLPLRNLYVIPVGFSGQVIIELADPTCPQPPIKNGFRRYVIPASGRLCAYTPNLGRLVWCSSPGCEGAVYYDRWVRAGAESTPLRTGGKHPEVIEINLGPWHDRYEGNQLMERTFPLSFRVVNPQP